MKRFTIVQNDAPKVVFDTEATTVGELRAELAAHEVDYQGRAIFEGLTRLELTNANDDVVLPHDVNYKGNVTSDLVFMITAAQKKISSGIDRKELYAQIKEFALEEVVKIAFGKNYTQVSSENLMKIIEEHKERIAGDAKPVDELPSDVKADAAVEALICAIRGIINLVKVVNAVPVLLEVLVAEGILTSVVEEPTAKEPCQKKEEALKSAYSDDDIAEMFD